MPTKRVKGKKKLKSIKSKQTDTFGSKRRAAKLGKEQKKGHKGYAANYITRAQALKRLQISLKDFRRLCILKGVYPRDPKKKVKGKDKAYYYVKDVMYLAHEPVLEKFREMKTFMKRIAKSFGKKNYADVKRREEQGKPTYSLDHIVKERYPRFVDAISDLDDALCLVHLFARMPAGNGLEAQVTENCLKLVREWQNYVVVSRSLSKTFISIKGIYYQANVHGENITWLVPHQFTPTYDERVDLRVMHTFLEFYQVLLKFVLYQLYSEMGVQYPPKIDLELDEAGAQLDAIRLEKLNNKSKEKKTEEKKTEMTEQQKESEDRLKSLKDVTFTDNPLENEEELEYGQMTEALEATFASSSLALQLQKQEDPDDTPLFRNLVFYLSREVPKEPLEFVVKAHGGYVAWDGSSKIDETSDKITHHVVDRPQLDKKHKNREYIQPQWVFDSVNNGILLPVSKYAIGVSLPPHLSPFVDDSRDGYVPDYRKELDNLKSAAQMLKENGSEFDTFEQAEEQEEAEEEYAEGVQAELDGEESGKEEEEPVKKSKKKKQEEEDAELHEMAKTMMGKKAKRLYDRMQHGLGKKADKIQALEDKKAKLQTDKSQKKRRKH